MNKRINSKNAPAPVGPYSHAVVAQGKHIYVSEQIPLTIDGELAGSDIETQTRQALKNVHAILVDAGATLADVVKVNVYMKDLSDFPKMNAVYDEFFKDVKPARSAFEVNRIPKDALIGVDAVAAL